MYILLVNEKGGVDDTGRERHMKIGREKNVRKFVIGEDFSKKIRRIEESRIRLSRITINVKF
jgi:hypothetical protein